MRRPKRDTPTRSRRPRGDRSTRSPPVRVSACGFLENRPAWAVARRRPPTPYAYVCFTLASRSSSVGLIVEPVMFLRIA